MKRTFSATLLVAILAVGAAPAADKPASATGSRPQHQAFQPPKPAAEMGQIANLLGVWEANGTFEPSEWAPQGGTSRGREIVRLGPGGHSHVFDYNSEGVMGKFQGHGVTAWDAREKAYKNYWLDNWVRGAQVSTGQWEGKDLVFWSNYVHEGKAIKEKLIIADITPAAHTMKMYQQVEGGPLNLVMTIKYKKSKRPNA